MVRKVFKTGHSTVVSLPKDALDYLGLAEGMQVSVDLDREKRQIVIKAVEKPLVVAGIDEVFTRQVAVFIEQYRPALEVLAKE
jgi:antitoxin MazE